MTTLLRSIFGFMNRDLTGRSWERIQKHPYFGDMIYFGSKDPSKCYWEAELLVSGQAEKIGVTMRGNAENPEPLEEAFCRSILSNLDALFERCSGAFRDAFVIRLKRPSPDPWHGAFTLDGFSVPPNGDQLKPWEVCYRVESVGRFFTAEFKDGAVCNVIVDG